MKSDYDVQNDDHAHQKRLIRYKDRDDDHRDFYQKQYDLKHFFGRYLTAGFVQDDKEQHPGSLRQVCPAGRNSADRLGTEKIIHFIKLREEHQRVQKIDRRDNHTAKDKVPVFV